FADPRGGVGGREVDLAQLRVDRRGIPERGADVLVGAVVRQRVATRFLRRGGGVEAPVDLAGLSVEGGEATADAVLATGAADVDFAVVVQRRRGDRVAAAW